MIGHTAVMALFHQFEIWKKGVELVTEIYRVTRSFPAEERYGLTSQLRRASTSILANFAEGTGRYTYSDKAAKFVIARGECLEVHAFLLMAIALGFCSCKDAASSLDGVQNLSRMISGLIRATRSSG